MTTSAASFPHERHAGVLLPLFSAASTDGWGIGEIPDLVTLAAWQRRAGLDFLLMLPVSELAPSGHQSPYATLSAMAIDPIYIRVEAVAEFAAAGGIGALPAGARARLAEVRVAPRVEYDAVRELKLQALRLGFDRFDRGHWRLKTERAAEFVRFRQREAGWLDDYCLYRALRDRFASQPWWEWPDGLATREPAAVTAAIRSLDRELRFHAYLQWLADTQWQAARQAAGIRLFGDVPFVVGADSADVWQNQHAFDRTLSVGTPPDAFSADGQDWGLPAYRWDVVEREDFAWLRARARRGTAMFDGYRVDHVIGFYRTYVREGGAKIGRFTPAEEEAQKALGRRIMGIFQDSGAAILAEDLGTVPDFLRESLRELGVPGYKVLRWERDWHAEGQPFLDPGGYAALSVTTTGTHDTESLGEWWESTAIDERAAMLRVPGLAERGFAPDQPFDDRLRDAFLELIYRSGANLVLLPIQDIFGWRDRINVPGTVGNGNWTWRLPFPLGDLGTRADAAERAAFLRQLAGDSGRSAS